MCERCAQSWVLGAGRQTQHNLCDAFLHTSDLPAHVWVTDTPAWPLCSHGDLKLPCHLSDVTDYRRCRRPVWWHAGDGYLHAQRYNAVSQHSDSAILETAQGNSLRYAVMSVSCVLIYCTVASVSQQKVLALCHWLQLVHVRQSFRCKIEINWQKAKPLESGAVLELKRLEDGHHAWLKSLISV